MDGRKAGACGGYAGRKPDSLYYLYRAGPHVTDDAGHGFLQSSRAVASARRINEILDTEIDLTDENAKQTSKTVQEGRIEFQQVSFRYYKDSQMLSDMKHILNWLCSNCYTPKTQTDNWWTWEIGLPKDLIPALVLLYDDLTPEETALYTEALTSSSRIPIMKADRNRKHSCTGIPDSPGGQYHRLFQNALGLGVLREDNELVYLASKQPRRR